MSPANVHETEEANLLAGKVRVKSQTLHSS